MNKLNLLELIPKFNFNSENVQSVSSVYQSSTVATASVLHPYFLEHPLNIYTNLTDGLIKPHFDSLIHALKVYHHILTNSGSPSSLIVVVNVHFNRLYSEIESFNTFGGERRRMYVNLSEKMKEFTDLIFEKMNLNEIVYRPRSHSHRGREYTSRQPFLQTASILLRCIERVSRITQIQDTHWLSTNKKFLLKRKVENIKALQNSEAYEVYDHLMDRFKLYNSPMQLNTPSM